MSKKIAVSTQGKSTNGSNQPASIVKTVPPKK